MSSLSMLMLFTLLVLPGQSKPPQSDEPILVCTVTAVPYGYVIVGKTSTEQCRTNIELPERDNTLIIKRPAFRETICERSPYPNNYAVVARTRLITCPNTGNETDNNAWIINRMK